MFLHRCYGLIKKRPCCHILSSGATLGAMSDTTARKRTLARWLGFLLTVLGALSNGLPFIGFPAAPVSWITLLLSLLGFAIVVLGLWRAFGQSTVYKGKLSGSIVAEFFVLVMVGAVFFSGAHDTFLQRRQLLHEQDRRCRILFCPTAQGSLFH